MSENIVFAVGKIYTNEDIERAVTLAHANNFIAELPDGYDSIIGDRGLKLFGGQLQLAIARSVVRSPENLVLDEATSGPDSHSEQLIHRMLE